MTARGVLAMAALAACAGPARPPPALPKNGEPPAALDAPCPPAGPVSLPADRRLHCRQLPFEVEFPAGTDVVRQDNGTIAMFTANLDHGVLAVIVEPKVDMSVTGDLDAVLESAMTALATDAVGTPIEIPTPPGAVAARGLTFTTPDGGAGVVRGYYAHHWMIAIVAGGRLAATPARPDQPAGQRFLASFRLRPLPAGLAPLALVDGAAIQIPATGWDAGAIPGDERVRYARWFVVPDRAIALGIRVLDTGELCTRLRLAADSELAGLVDHVLTGDGLVASRVERIAHGVYFEATDNGHAMVSDVECAGASTVQIIAVGDPPYAHLRALTDEVAATVVGAPDR